MIEFWGHFRFKIFLCLIVLKWWTWLNLKHLWIWRQVWCRHDICILCVLCFFCLFVCLFWVICNANSLHLLAFFFFEELGPAVHAAIRGGKIRHSGGCSSGTWCRRDSWPVSFEGSRPWLSNNLLLFFSVATKQRSLMILFGGFFATRKLQKINHDHSFW